MVSGEEPSIENTLETLDQAVAETPEFVEGEAQTLEPTRIEADPEAAEIDDKDQQSEAQLTQIEGPF
ncbi:MAG: hypothetical protein GWN97_22465 [Thermoplasmata archaeon]|nr:hypothetical protein [Thermoplasmata archaeon]NIT80336.1 hypothetical protein [Thermoplasmata archaeon]NIY06704.1 hypothetical protein [Thermoplasmata archaeon]